MKLLQRDKVGFEDLKWAFRDFGLRGEALRPLGGLRFERDPKQIVILSNFGHSSQFSHDYKVNTINELLNC